MRKFVDANSVANTVRMTRSLFKGAFVIVEGSSDVRVYKRFTDSETCRMIPALGKANATGALKILESDHQEGILIIIDSDFSKLNDTKTESENSLSTDSHDLETMILASSAFEKVIDEFCSERKIARSDKPLSDVLLEIGKPIGFFRWISSSKQENFSLRFKNLSYEYFINFTGGKITVDIAKLIKEVLRRSKNIELDEHEIAVKIRKLLRDESYDSWHVCRGHDLVHILTFLLRYNFGNKKAKSITYEVIDSILRIAYGYTEFSGTRLFGSIKNWEQSNPGYRVLRSEANENNG